MYTKSDINNDGGQAGGDAILTNMEEGIENAGMVGDASGANTNIINLATTTLNFSTNTALAPIAVGDFSFRARIGSDEKGFDPVDCSIVNIEYYITASGVPLGKGAIFYHEGPESYVGSGYFTLGYCGKKFDDVSTITPVDNTTDITLSFPGGHGLPVGLEGAGAAYPEIIFSSGGISNGDVNYNLTEVNILSVDDADTMTIGMTLASWNVMLAAAVSANVVSLNMYFRDGIFIRGGGNDFSGAGLNTAVIVIRSNTNASTFAESVFSDD